MFKALMPEDIRDLLLCFAAAIELDQLRIDAMPREKFHPAYSDSMWRLWRSNHREYIDKILPTVNAIPSGLLNELTRVAITYEPAAVGQILIHTFADAASGCCAEEEFETASLFLGWFIEEIRNKPPEKSISSRDASARVMKWLPVTDPLRISKDPERLWPARWFRELTWMSVMFWGVSAVSNARAQCKLVGPRGTPKLRTERAIKPGHLAQTDPVLGRLVRAGPVRDRCW
jgi:hypothetical protein